MKKKRKKKNNLNLYIPVVLVALFSLFLVFERIYTNGNDFEFFSGGKNSLTLLSDKEWEEYYNKKSTDYNEKSLIIYDHSLDFSIETKNNIKYVLGTMSVKTYIKDVDELNEEDDLKVYDTLVLCVQDLSSIEYSVDKLEEYVFNGGGLLFAVDIIQFDTLEEYLDLLGATGVEKNYVGVDNLVFADNFLIGSKGESFDEMIVNANVLKFDLKENTNVHIVSNDSNKVPLVWDFKYGDGYVGVSNSSLLTSKNGRGLIAALFSVIHEVFVYPVINAAVYFIDDFPAPVPGGYDEFVVKEYGYSVKDFYANVWWPTMHGIAKEKGVKFSSYIIQTYEDDVNGSFDTISFNEEYKYYINELLVSGGEMGIHGYNHQPLVVNNYYYGEGIVYNPWPSADKAIGSIKTILNYTKEVANGSLVISYVPPSNILSEEMYLKMQEGIPEMKIFASLYVGDGGVSFDQEFDVLENGTINLPRLYSNMEISQDSRFMLLNELSYHYIVSHFMHPDDILDPDRRSEEGFAYMTDKYIELIDFVNGTKIRNTTVSQAGAAIERYQLTSANREYIDGKLKLEVSGIVDEVYYFLKTNGKKIKSAEGCLVEEIAENYYLLTICDKLVEIEME